MVAARRAPDGWESGLGEAARRLLGELAALAEPLPLALVGGAVRDLLLARGASGSAHGKSSAVVETRRGRPDERRRGAGHGELDLAVEADDAALAALVARFEERLGPCARRHPPFRLCRWEGRGDEPGIDLSGARAETYAAPGALPRTRPATLEDDLLRRDFSVNALAIVVAGPRRGELLDPGGGLDDLAARRLRTLHARSYEDDPTRLARGVRFEARLGFRLTAEDEDAARRAFAGAAPDAVAPSRVGRELRSLLAEPDPAGALARLVDLGAGARWLPGLRQGSADDVRAAAAAALAAAVALGADDDLSAALVHAATTCPERAAERAERVALSSRARRALLEGMAQSRRLERLLREAPDDAALVRAVYRAAPGTLLCAAAFAGAEALERAARARRLIDAHPPLLAARDLIDLGVPAGPELQDWLARLAGERAAGRVADRAAAVALILDRRPT
ncbi:hypothetical protein LLG88_06160 [bacterium]|nr:hypothetical protein [bacterium]